MSELTQEHSTRNGIYTENFGYDAAGNATTWKGATQTFNQNNQNTAWPFDANGNPTTYKGAALAFDPESRLTAYGSALTAAYNAFGQRAWKQGSAGRTYFLYDGATPVIEMDGNGTVTAVNSFGPNGLLSRHASGASTFYTFDPQGSVVQRLNSTGAVLDTHAFDAYGAELSTPASGDPWGYEAQAGYYTDHETGLQLLSQRYYDPSQGQFLTRDPLGYGGGMDLYAYCGNSPTSQIDPLGLGPQPGQDWGRSVANGIAGFGYGLSGGLIQMLWHLDGVEDEINEDSLAFKVGRGAGIIHVIAMAGVGTGAFKWLGTRLTLLLGGGAAGAGAKSIQQIGEEGEEAVSDAIGIARNIGPGRVTIPGTGPGGYRIPDFDPDLTIAARNTVVEVKNVQTLGITQQLRDLITYAQSRNVALEIFTNAPAPSPVSELGRAVAGGRVILRPIP